MPFFRSFNGSIMFCIAFNSITLAAETATDTVPPAAIEGLKKLDNFFLAIYTFEFLVKMYVSPTAYFTNAFCLFDFLILVLSWVDLITTQTMTDSASGNLAGLRVLRILRTLRALRAISFVPSLQVIVTALITTVRDYMLNLIVVLFLIVFIFGVMGFYLYGQYSDKFSNLGESMLALGMLVTLDSWTMIDEGIPKQGPTLPIQ